MLCNFHVFLSDANAWLAFERRARISSPSPLVAIFDPKHVKLSTSSIGSPFSVTVSSVLVFIRRCFVFLALIFSPILSVVVAMMSVFVCMSWCRCVSKAISSAKSKSSRMVVSVHLIPLCPSLVTCFIIQSIPRMNRNGERMHPCFMPVVTLKASVNSVSQITWDLKSQ